MSVKFIIYIISSMCAKYPPDMENNCRQFMRTCTFNENMIGTYNPKTSEKRTLETMLEDCRESWYEQR